MPADYITISFHGPYGREKSVFSKLSRKIDLTTQVIEAIDLSQVSLCENLEVLDISDNQLKSIDLTPLEHCKNFRELKLNSNNLSTVNLWPLQKCRRLVELDLTQNWLECVNLTPIVDRTITTVDRTSIVQIDVMYFYLFHILKMNTNIIAHAGKSQNIMSRFPPHIQWIQYSKQHHEGSWKTLKERILTAIEHVDSEYWFHIQKGILESLGMGELSGYDGNPKDIVYPVDQSLPLSIALEQIYENVTHLLEQQIIRGGPTTFLEVDEFRKTAASRLISLIVKEREDEIKNARILIHGNKVLLRSLWFTAYGFDLLRALELSLETDRLGLAQVEASLNKVGLHVKTEEIDDSMDLNRPDISKSMENFILDIARSMKQEPDLVRRKAWSET